MTFSPGGKYFALSEQGYVSKYDKDGNINSKWGHQPSSLVEIHDKSMPKEKIKMFTDLSDAGIDGVAVKACSVASVFFSNGNKRIMMVGKEIEYLEYKCPELIEFERYTIDTHSVATDKPYRKRCIRYAVPMFSIFKGKLSEKEKGLLLAALSTIGSFDELDSFGWLDDFNKRLGLVEHEPIIQMSKNLLEDKTLIAEAFSAIQAKFVVITDAVNSTN